MLKPSRKILRKEIDHKRVVTNAFDRSSIGLYDDIYELDFKLKFIFQIIFFRRMKQ